jgi:alkanesulfonate monooxygenase SsuD/methylene tetrahydromethanopterin reductase-like flavin-dependent oxidoreductase (luciferase family)
MKFGLFSESGLRGNPVAAQTYDEDLAEILLGEELGFDEVWVAERGTRTRGQSPDILSASNLLICKAAALTKRIRFGTGIKPLGYHHPFTIATEANVCDHLTGGRYILGWGGTGGARGDHPTQLGLDPSRLREMVYESVDYILRCFTSPEPFDFEGQFWRGKGINVLPKPLQQPHVPIAAATAGDPRTLSLAGSNGFIALLGRGGDEGETLREWGDGYMEAARAAGLKSTRSLFRVAYHVHLSDSVAKARDELRATMGRSIERQQAAGQLEGLYRWVTPGRTVQDVDFDMVLETGRFLHGDQDTVAGAIERLFHESGGFGTLLLFSGQGYVTREQTERSLRLFSQGVMPALAHLSCDEES